MVRRSTFALLASVLGLSACADQGGSGDGDGGTGDDQAEAETAQSDGDELGDEGGSGSTEGPELEPGPCAVTSRFTLFEELDDGYVSALSRNGDELGVLLWVDPIAGSRHLRFGQTSLSSPTPFEGTPPLVESPLVSDVGLVPSSPATDRPPSFHAAWAESNPATEGFAIHVGRVRGDVLVSDSVVAVSPSSRDVGLGRTGGDRYLVNWVGEAEGPDGHELLAAASDNGEDFGEPHLIATTGTPYAATYTTLDDGAAMAWIARLSNPSRTALHFARLDEQAAAIAPMLALTNHDRYVYDVALVRGATILGIGTTDSRVNIIDVPLYYTAIGLGGDEPTAGLRLTDQYPHEYLDMAWAGASFGMAYDEHDGANAEIWFRQLDEDGGLLFDPIQVSDATFVQWDCCTATRHAHVVADVVPGRFIVAWSELWARGDEADAWGVKAAVVDCSG